MTETFEELDLENKIRKLAYEKWQKAGCPLTNDEDRKKFWLEAEKEILPIKAITSPPLPKAPLSE